MTEPEVEIKYVWLDEDDNVVSRHLKFKAALAFISGWHGRWAKAMERWGGYERMPLHAAQTLSRTGKPPVHLNRLVVTSEYANLDEMERLTLQAFWQTANAISDL